MRIISFRRKSRKGWVVYVLVNKWRPVYDWLNARFAQEDNLAEWVIVDKERLHELHSS